MWQIENRTPFAADSGWVRDRDGAELWLVAVKCSFDIAPDGTTRPSDVQPEVALVPEYHGDPGHSSVRYDADIVRTKITTDILLVGHAYAPRGQRVTEVFATLELDAINKRLRITGDRVWETLGPGPPEPFAAMPLVYERAYGGVDALSAQPERDWDWRNPVGTGFVVDRKHLAGVRLPNIEYPDSPFTSWDDRPPPAGFGAIGSHWQPRARFAGTYDEEWLKKRQPLLPDDFDDHFYQCAPLDQQSPQFLRGGERVLLRHLTPDGLLQFVLPRVSLRFDTRFFTGEHAIHGAPNLHTVILEPDVPRVSLVWHTALPCHSQVQQLEQTLVTVKRTSASSEPDAVVDLEVVG